MGRRVPAPVARLRRMRRTPALRALAREATVSVDRLVQPMFVRDLDAIPADIAAMPGVRRRTPEEARTEAASLADFGIPAVLLFGIPGGRDDAGVSAANPEGVVPRSIRAMKRASPELVVMADVCLCEYTLHGHCGIVRDGAVDNDASLEALTRAAVAYAEAGADVVAPSAMMDGQVGAIRAALDDAGLRDTAIMGYSAKYASAFYGPFREAAESAPKFGDRRSYQMDPGNAREALREIALDVAEGADVVMVKPALPYLDVIRAARERFDLPLAAYSVSGEYAMAKAAAERGWLDERAVVREILTAIRRAGADLIISYAARDFAEWAKEAGR